MNSFLTLEDVNTALFSNQGFWWHELDTSVLDSDGLMEFSNVKFDFVTVTKEKIIYNNTISWKYSIVIDNNLWTKGVYSFQSGSYYHITFNENMIEIIREGNSNYLPVPSVIKLKLYMGCLELSSQLMDVRYLLENQIELSLKEVNVPYNVPCSNHRSGGTFYITQSLNVGYNEIIWEWQGSNHSLGYLLVKLLKTDFQFNCNQQLTLGKVNTVKLGAVSDYKPNGDLVGEYTPTITVKYGSVYIPVTFNTNLNDYTFELDLTSKQTEGKVKFKVFVDTNEVLNSSETDVILNSSFETINNFSKLQTLFSNGGIGRLGANISLTNDLTAVKSVYLIGNNKTLNMQSHKIIVPSEKTLKAENTTFNNGKNTIQQENGSNVELTECEFTGATGLGSVIDCQVDINNLNTENDFTTILTDCTINNCDTVILHGGDLTVTGCTVNGKISDKNYPYFLYQTDGEAVITGSVFNLTNDEQLDYDIEFNSCIFICGETATINGLNHSELQNNNLTSFLTTQRNTSTIDITYYYDLIEALVHFESNNGYCHSISGSDYIFKTNVKISRGE